MKFIELFAGIGGFRYGLESVNRAKDRGIQKDTQGQLEQRTNQRTDGFTCVWANEIDKYAAQIYRKNFGEGELYEGDITKVDAEEIPDHDLLVGGFPCQAFSIAGKRQGFNDIRGTLFFEIVRIAQEKRPRLLLLENVKGLLSHEKGRTFGTILSTLDEIGYDLQWQVLNSKNFGVPQNRERVFIIGHLRGTSRPQVFPIWESINSGSIKTGEICKTLLANYPGNSNGNYIGTENIIRRLTPTECERLQGFPDGWTEFGWDGKFKEGHPWRTSIISISDTQRYKCLGNAVTTNVIKAIGEKLF